MSRAQVSAGAAALRFVAVLVLVGAVVAWWRMQLLPDVRVDQRLRLAADGPGREVSSLRLAGGERDGRALLPGESVRYTVTVPGPQAELRWVDAQVGTGAELVVASVTPDGGRHEHARRATVDGAWTARRLPLPAEPGARLTLEFLAQTPDGSPPATAYLADVVLASLGRGVDESAIPVVMPAPVDDLIARSSTERVTAPPSGELRRAGSPGPVCVPLPPGRPFLGASAELPEGARLRLVVHAMRPWPEGSVPSGDVLIEIDGAPAGSLRLDEAEGERTVSVDLSSRAGRAIDLAVTRRGAEGMFVGLTEAWISAPRRAARRLLHPEHGRNVLLVTVPSLRADRLGCTGHRGAATPALDALAARGGRWERALSPSSWMLPNLASLLTGAAPLSHGLGLAPGRQLSGRLASLAETAAWSGITTALFSSSEPSLTGSGLQRGWETIERARLPAPMLVERFQDWLVDASQFTWFALLDLADPVLPCAPLPEDIARLPEADRSALTEALRPLDSRPGAAEALAHEVGPLYDGEVAAVDRALGLVLDALARHDLLERTLIVVVGLHGEEFYERKGRGHGQSLHEEVVRVPLIMAGPGVRGADGGPFVESAPIALVDVTRLLGHLGGLSSQSSVQGRLPPPFGPALSETVFASVLRPVPGVTGADLDAVRAGSWLWLRDNADGRTALFDLGSDPLARRDLLAAAGVRAAEQAALLERSFLDAQRATLAVAASAPVPAALEPSP